MKHYADEKWFEFAAYEFEHGKNPRIRKSLAEVKRGYRRRERAALKRATAELVAEELGKWRNAGYWEDVLEELFSELQSLECAEERDLELSEWYDGEFYDAKFYQAAYRDLFGRIDDAEYELAMVA